MRRFIFTIILFTFTLNNIFSQNISAFSHADEKLYSIEIPDTLFVVYGDRMRSINNIFIDRDETLIENDILFLAHPGTCYIDRVIDNSLETMKRINLELAIEVFFGENFSQNFDLKDDSEIVTITKHHVFSKNTSLELFKFKSTFLIFLDVEGNVIPKKEYYDRKFHLHNIVKIIFNGK